MLTGFLQYAPEFAEPEKNFELCKSYIMNSKADLLVLPELALSGYFFTSREKLKQSAEIIRDKCIPGLAKLCALKNMAIVMGYPELADDKIYNSALMMLPDQSMQTYRKMHLFGSEKDVFDRAENKFTIFEWQGVKIGLLVCFDHYFPEAARSLALAGVQLICQPANLVLEGKAQLTTRVRAMENRIFWVLANRTGEESANSKTVRFTGASQVVGPDGDVLLDAVRDDIGCGIIEIDPAEALNKNVTEANDIFKDRRADFYNLD